MNALNRLLAATLLTLLSSVLVGCPGSDSPSREPRLDDDTQCSEASKRLGELVCLNRVPTYDAWLSIGAGLTAIDQVRAAKYMLPARDDARLGPVFLNSKRFDLHYEFLVEAFGDLFPSLSPQDYLALLFDPERQEYFVGALIEFRLASGETKLGFTLGEDSRQPGMLACADLRKLHGELASRVFAGKSLAVVPSSKQQLAWMERCDLPLIDPSKNVTYEVYHRAVGYGTVRLVQASKLSDALQHSELGLEDILVIDAAPADLDTIVSGVITGTRQGPLSHLAVRSASRGTPNCFLAGAHGYLSAFKDKLVRMECASTSLEVREASLDEATKFWDSLRPTPVTIPEPDASYDTLVRLDALALDTPEERALAVRRFGAKGTNLVWLRQNMATSFTPDGFLIPLAFYLRFLEQETFEEKDLGLVSFADALNRWLDDATFLSNAQLRRERLVTLQEAMRDASCDPTLIATVAEHIVSVFGKETETVRFRSSSNAEDGAFFNGAGLYDSYSGCLADDLDDDDTGPSRCDPEEPKERGVCRALKKVWASTWNIKAFEERAFYGIDQRRAAMGVLVNARSEAERANLVAFTGNPTRLSDARYLVNAQTGEIPVVSPMPGVFPEQSLLRIVDGTVSEIERVAVSSELPEGTRVLSDAHLKQLGAELARLAKLYPFDASPPSGRTFLLDTEWKVMPDNSLRIKQVRPFLH